MTSIGTFLFQNVFVKILAKIFQGTFQRLHGPGCKGAKGISRAKVFCMKFQQLHILRAPFTPVDRRQNFFYPREPLPAGCTKSARLLRKKMLQVLNEAYRACL